MKSATKRLNTVHGIVSTIVLPQELTNEQKASIENLLDDIDEKTLEAIDLLKKYTNEQI